jgi:hypothetical protein
MAKYLILLLALASSCGAATLNTSWSAVTTRTDGTPCEACTYRVYQDGTAIADTAQVSHAVTVAPGTYTMAVAAVDSAGTQSLLSTAPAVTVVAPTPITTPPAPAMLQAQVSTLYAVAISWAPVPGATYRLFDNGVILAKTSSTSYKIPPGSGEHRYTVAAVIGGVQGPLSNAAVVTVSWPRDTNYRRVQISTTVQIPR